MSGLPITNNPEAAESLHIKTQEPDIPDLSNPYSYPSNPSSPTADAKEGSAASINIPPDQGPPWFTEMQTETDPELSKLKNALWRRAGQLQSAIGSITGLESWQTSGERVQQDAERKYREAETRLTQGEPSRIHGEYDRLMGYVSYAVGHVAGDPEMQAKASERSEHGAAEIDRSSRP